MRKAEIRCTVSTQLVHYVKTNCVLPKIGATSIKIFASFSKKQAFGIAISYIWPLRQWHCRIIIATITFDL